jgi:arylsulfatase A-like enzyme
MQDEGARRGPASETVGEVGLERAHLFAWIALACVNAVVLAVGITPARTPLGVRLILHVYDFGQLVALGLVTRLALWAWRRWGKPGRGGYGALFAAALVLALLLMGDDLESFTQRHASLGGKRVVYVLTCLGAASATTVAAVVSRLLARPWLRWLPAVGALGAVAINHFVLRGNYPASHLFATWLAALALGNALSTARAPEPLTSRLRARAALGLRAAQLLGVLGCAATLVWPPRASVRRELVRSSGSVVAPLLARFLPAARAPVPQPRELSAWFRDRRDEPPVPPSRPSLLPDNPIVVFMTIDALRADVVAGGKHARELPNIEALRRRSIEFSVARTPSPSTITSISSMFTGKYYTGIHWSTIASGPFKDAIMPHRDDSPRLPALLGAAGVKTVHAISLWGLAAAQGVGIGFGEELSTAKDYGHAANLMDLVLARLKRNADGPHFIYFHFVDSHAPYNLGGTQGTDYERYLREVALVDQEVGRLSRFLETSGLQDRTVLVLSADHGEAFGEHGARFHATTLYEEMIRVPLLVRLPGKAHRIIDEPVSLIDLGPTLLDLFGAQTPGHFLGQSLVPLLRGEDKQLTRPIGIDAGRRMQTLYLADCKPIVDLKKQTQEVYDLSVDPGEKRNLVDADPERSARCLGALQTFFAAHAFRKEGYQVPWRPF